MFMLHTVECFNFSGGWQFKHKAGLNLGKCYVCFVVSAYQMPNFFVFIFVVVTIPKDKRPSCLFFFQIAKTTEIKTKKLVFGFGSPADVTKKKQ